jgi:hypothetical protein
VTVEQAETQLRVVVPIEEEVDGVTYHIYVNKRLLTDHLKSESPGKGKHVLWVSYTFYTYVRITDMPIAHLQ